MKVLVIGSGGREHAICWKVAQSKRVDTLFCAPGNGGISKIATLVNIEAEDIDSLLKFAKSNNIDLTIVGPEAPLIKGIVDIFQKEGLRIFGPTRSASMIEGSKIFAKEMMKRWQIPTADFAVFNDYREAEEYVKQRDLPLVVKADGLAAGKGVTVCHTRDEALMALKDAMVNRRFGPSGERVVIEDCLEGEEASIIVISDGENVVPMATSQDHKRVFDDDKGPNTGGMGAYSPAPVVTPKQEHRIMNEIIIPMIKGMAHDSIYYKGVLYAGIMVTTEGPKVLEFNVRFGDPEIQTIFPRLMSDLIDLIERTIDGNLKGCIPVWDKRSCICVVMASGGYPGKYEKGKEIQGLDKVERMKDVVVFHAGTKKPPVADRRSLGKYLTNGGRVLGVTGLGESIELAIKKTYKAVTKIKFDNMHFRRDIGRKALLHSGIIVS
jgi:phosphoribosylamine--glycine ligase